MATKIYIKKGCNNYRTTLRINNFSLNVEFSDGNVLMGVPSQIVTDDAFLQFMLERDERYGSVWMLHKTIGEVSPSPAKESVKGKKASKSLKNVTEVPDVTNLTDAIDWMAERGRLCDSKESVQEAMDEMKVVFPNFK